MAIEEYYRSVFDHLNVSLVTLNRDLKIQYLNPSAEMLLDVSRGQIIGKSFIRLFKVDGSPQQVIMQASGHRSQFTKRRAHWQLHNGRELSVDYSVTPLQDNKGMVIEILHLDRLLRISREETLITSQETTRHLVRKLAHEIKNPLGGIRGAAQLLSRELPDPSLEEFTQVIIEETDRLSNLVDRMLGPRQLPKFELINIHQIIEHVARVMQAECGSQISIQKDYDPSIPELNADHEMMVQALLNVTRNAMQSLLELDDGKKKKILFRTRVKRQFTISQHYHHLVCVVEIVDNGPGIPEDLLDDIFYPMISGRPMGTGLGLAISQQLIQQHQGLIECDSKPGETTFSIYLPLEQHDAH